jgi:hypothetical protein
MPQTAIKAKYTLQTLSNKHAKLAVEHFTKVFCETEDLTSALGIHPDEYQLFVTDVIHKAIKDGMSKIALDKDNRVIACTVAEDMAVPFTPRLSLYPKMRPLFALLEKLSLPFADGKIFIKNKIVHVWYAAVDAQFRGQGFSIVTDMACIEEAARRGFNFAYAEFVNPISENITHQFKVLKLCNTIQYRNFFWNDQRPFQGLNGQATAYMASINPKMGLDALPACYNLNETC